MSLAVIFIIYFFILLPIVLYSVIPTYKKHRKVGKSIVNYDPFMRKFVFKIGKTKEEIITILSTERKRDSFSCTLSKAENIITFYEHPADAKYLFDIQEFDSYCILRLQQLTLASNWQILYNLNPFMVKTLDAEIIPYFE